MGRTRETLVKHCYYAINLYEYARKEITIFNVRESIEAVQFWSTRINYSKCF
jgi:hypothetical protein